MIYRIGREDITPSEPAPGWYYVRTNEDGEEEICGPFGTRAEALDDMSDGAFSEWQASRYEYVDSYADDLRNSGHKHLLRGGES